MRNVQPGGRVTGIGSLPHTNPVAAIRFVAAACPELPFWPQLPQRSAQEDMILQMLSPLADLFEPTGFGRLELDPVRLPALLQQLRTAEAAFAPRHAAGFFAFEQAVAGGAFAQARALKGQMYGPLTIARCLYVNHAPLHNLPGVHAVLTDYLCRLAHWQIARLRRFGKPVILFVDEPALALEAPAAPVLDHVRQLIQTIHAAGAHSGLHCCAAAHPATLAKVAPDILSFDAHQALERFVQHESIRRFVGAGGWLALGLIPTLTDLSTLAVADIFARWVGAAVAGDYEIDQLAAQSLITATCGLGLLNEASARQSFWHAQRLADRLWQPATAPLPV